MTDLPDVKRHLAFIKRMSETLDLSLKGLTVLTECASGAYAYTAVAALMTGAKVIAYGKDTRFGSYEDNAINLRNILSQHDPSLMENLLTTDNKEKIDYSQVDILTNSGLLRPITVDMISKLKSTSVIPLMWETWEFRQSDLDICACQQYNIPVIGTNEHFGLADLSLTAGLLALRALFDIRIPLGNCNLVLIGSGHPAIHMANLFDRIGLRYVWFTPMGNERPDNCYPYSQLKKIYTVKYVDAIVCAEHHVSDLIAGKDGEISFRELSKAHPLTWWVHLFGNIDEDELSQSGMAYYPKNIRPFGYQTYGTENLGFEPVIQLNVCGLKVGGLAAKARQDGKSIDETIKITVNYGIGQDFEGGFLCFRP